MIHKMLTLLMALQMGVAATAEMPCAAKITCPSLTLQGGEVVQLIMKETFVEVPSMFHLSSGFSKGYRCLIPACSSNPCQHGATCEETQKGFECRCLNGYQGDTCEDKGAFIHSLRLLGGSDSEGIVAFTSRTRPAKYMLIHQGNWSRNASRLVCRYLGFEDVYATLSGNFFNVSSADYLYETVTVRCPANVSNITDCWYNDTTVNERTESIGVVCCTLDMCGTPRGKPVGLESGEIPDAAITVSSYFSHIVSKERARLNSQNAWVPHNSDEDPWLQIEFESVFVITAIMTRGRANADQWVTSYTVSSALDGVSMTYYQDIYKNATKVFRGNFDRTSSVVHIFYKPVVCRFFRIHPKTYHSHAALRLELNGYGPLSDVLAAMNREAASCSPPIRGEGMGVEDGRIPDSSLTSSTIYSDLYPAAAGRLNGGVSNEDDAGWIANDNDDDKWVKIDLGKVSTVTGVVMQGRYEFQQWVTSIRISYSMDDLSWTYAFQEECGDKKIYSANYDNNTPETILFPQPISARYVRVHPVTWTWHPAMRYEVLGILEKEA